MVYGGRPSTGCFLCLKRKIRCDEALPGCRNCHNYRRPCPGYRPNSIFRDETEKTKQLVRRASKYPPNGQYNKRNTSPRGRSRIQILVSSPCHIADSTWDDRAICYFFDQYASYGRSAQYESSLGLVPSLYALCRENKQDSSASSSLRLALDATALLTLGNEIKAPSLVVKARHLYGISLQKLQQSLNLQAEALKDETFVAVVLLSLFEDISGERRVLSNSHTAGLEVLIRLRQQHQLLAPGWDLFNFTIVQVFFRKICLGDKPQFKTPALFLVSLLDKLNSVDGLLLLASKVYQIYVEASSKWSVGEESIAKLVSCIESAKLIDIELAQWSQSLPVPCLPLVVYSQTGETLMTYRQIFFVYHWAWYRVIRIFLQKSLLDLQGILTSIVGDRDDCSIIEGGAAAVQVIQQMITDMCQSIPYALGEIDELGNPISSSSKPRIRGFQAYRLIWPLWYILSCKEATPEQTHQIRAALAWLGSRMGIKLALVMASEGMTVKQKNPCRKCGAQ